MTNEKLLIAQELKKEINIRCEILDKIENKSTGATFRIIIANGGFYPMPKSINENLRDFTIELLNFELIRLKKEFEEL